MRKIKVVTDSTCDLSEDELSDFQIHVVPLSISIDGKTYLDRVEITPQTFIEKMKQAKELPKSSQPSTGTFLELYNELGKDGSEVLSIHMTGKLSGTVESARTAAQMSNTKVTVVDSLFISQALGFQVIKAASMAREGNVMADILEELEKIRLATRLYIVMETLENLVKGGRIGKGRALIGSLLNIKPIIRLDEGEIHPVGRVRSQSQAIKQLLNQFIDDVKGKTVKSVAISHADALDLAERMKLRIEELITHVEVKIEDTTPIISTHTGSGTLGLIYYTE